MVALLIACRPGRSRAASAAPAPSSHHALHQEVRKGSPHRRVGGGQLAESFFFLGGGGNWGPEPTFFNIKSYIFTLLRDLARSVQFRKDPEPVADLLQRLLLQSLLGGGAGAKLGRQSVAVSFQFPLKISRYLFFVCESLCGQLGMEKTWKISCLNSAAAPSHIICMWNWWPAREGFFPLFIRSLKTTVGKNSRRVCSITHTSLLGHPPVISCE